MIIDCIADLHGEFPKLEGGDLLIVAGDCGCENLDKYTKFGDWLYKQPYKRRIFIAGNHDNQLYEKDVNGYIMNGRHTERTNITYLFDSGTEFEGLKVWGSPWTKRFEGMNPHCMAFTVDTDEELAEKWDLIPDDTDILITHCPPYGVRDRVRTQNGYENCGSKSLRMRIFHLENIKLHVFGHIHEGYGPINENKIVNFRSVNASIMNEEYEPMNKPIRIEL